MGASQCVNRVKNLLLLGNREQGTGNRKYIGKKYFYKYLYALKLIIK